MNTLLNKHTWVAILLTLISIVVIREISVAFATYIGFASMGNIIGMIWLFTMLLVWRFVKGLPDWLTISSNKILTESALAYLPVSAGAGILLFKLGDQFWGVMAVMLISTILPLWAFAKLAEYWFQPKITDEQALVTDKENI